MVFVQLRAFGVLGCVIATVLYMAGCLTDHWVDSDNGHFGLWEICEDSKHHNVSMNITTTTTTTTTTTPGFGHGFGRFTTPSSIEDDSHEKDDDDDDDDDDEEEDSCSPFDITSIPAFFHIVRAMMVLSGIVLAYGMLSGRSLQVKVPDGDSFSARHISELSGCGACIFAAIALALFDDNYKTIHEEKFPNSHLDWSISLTRTCFYLYFPAALFMMSPSIAERYSSFDCDIGRLCMKMSGNTSRRARPSSDNERSNHLENSGSHNSIRSRYFLNINNSNRNSHTDTPIAAATEGSLSPDGSFRLSETGSDIFTVTITDDDRLPPPAADGSDLPQYEDVTGPNSHVGVRRVEEDTDAAPVPPPPSYDDVLSGGYLAFSPSAPPNDSLLPPSAPSLSISSTESATSSVRSSSNCLPPPPPYQYDSNV